MTNNSTDISYIRSIMQKSEISFKDFRALFLFLAVWGALSQFIFEITDFRIPFFSDEKSFYSSVFSESLNFCIYNILSFIPTVIFMLLERRSVKRRNLGISLWIFDILFFVIIFCGSVLPIASTAVSGYSDTSRLYRIVTAALCILISAVTVGSKALKTAAYFYTAVPLIILSVFGLVTFYLDSFQFVSVTLVTVFMYVKAFFYLVYPALGYFYAALFMHRSLKRTKTQ